MRDRSVFVFSVAIALIGVWALLETRGWPIQAWLYPRVVLVPLVVLALAESLAALRGRESPLIVEFGEGARLGPEEGGREAPTDFALDSTVDPSLALRRTFLTAGWILGFFVSVILIGFQVAVPVFVLAYLRNSKERWLLSVVLAAAAALVFHGLFVSLLHLPLPPGVLGRLLGR